MAPCCLNINSFLTTRTFILLHKLNFMPDAGLKSPQAHPLRTNIICRRIWRCIFAVPNSTNYIGTMNIALFKSYEHFVINFWQTVKSSALARTYGYYSSPIAGVFFG